MNTSNGVHINDANVIEANIPADNGLIHVIESSSHSTIARTNGGSLLATAYQGSQQLLGYLATEERSLP